MSKKSIFEQNRDKYKAKEKLIEEGFFKELAALCTKYHVSINQTSIDITVDGIECERIKHFPDHEWYMYSVERTVAFADGI